MHIMVCVSGFAGVGKDEFCKRLMEKYGAVHTGLIDAGKRHLAELYEFSEEQLFGPSRYRNLGDLRYPKSSFFEHGLYQDGVGQWGCKKDGKLMVVEAGDPKYWLSPREALQIHGEVMNKLYNDTWIEAGIRLHRIVSKGGKKYSRMGGAQDDYSIPKRNPFISCFSDFRHWHEIKAARAIKDPGFKCVIVRIQSLRIPGPAFNHRSETEQTTIPDTEFDYVVKNDSSLEDLYSNVDRIMFESMEKVGNDPLY